MRKEEFLCCHDSEASHARVDCAYRLESECFAIQELGDRLCNECIDRHKLICIFIECMDRIGIKTNELEAILDCFVKKGFLNYCIVNSLSLKGVVENDLLDLALRVRKYVRNNDFGPGLELRVAKAVPSDVGLGRIRVPIPNELGVKPGDIVTVEGGYGKPLPARGQTAAIVWRARPEDSNLIVARMDGIIRRNARVNLDEIATMRKIEPSPCKELVIRPNILHCGQWHRITEKGVIGHVRRGLNKRPLVEGDSVFVPGLPLSGELLPFNVIRTSPRGVVLVNPDTRILISNPENRRSKGKESICETKEDRR